LAIEQLVDLSKAGDRHNVDEQRVSVWLRRCSNLPANLSGCARFGLDHARLLEDRLQDSGERTCDDVGGATWREWIDESNGV
jgi:hypothetical protein